jgi:hypothetical protein
MKEILVGFADGQTAFELTDKMYEQLIEQAKDTFAHAYVLVDENKLVILFTKDIEFIELAP